MEISFYFWANSKEGTISCLFCLGIVKTGIDRECNEQGSIGEVS